MPDQNAATRPFIRDGQPAEDRWVLIREDEAVLPDAPAIVPLARWQAREEGRVLAPGLPAAPSLHLSWPRSWLRPPDRHRLSEVHRRSRLQRRSPAARTLWLHR